MNLKMTFLRSKLARRTFWLFVLCALVPITVLAVVSLGNVTAQLREQSFRELRQISREESMNIYGRLSFLGDNLKFAALSVGNASDKSIAPTAEITTGLYSELAGRFEGLELFTPDGHHRNLYGPAFRPIDSSGEDLAFLRSGRNLLSTVPCGKPVLCIFLSRLLDVGHKERGIVAGEIRPAYLWDVENARDSVTLCVLNPSGETLFCSGESPDRFPKSITESSSGEFEWKGG